MECLFQGLNSKRSDIINIKTLNRIRTLKILLTKFSWLSSSLSCHFSQLRTLHCRCGHKGYSLAYVDRLVLRSFINIQTAG